MLKILSEHQEQCLVISWFEMQYPKFSELLIAIPNGGWRGWSQGRRFKAEGVRAGAPDLILAIPNGQYPGFFIEMKTTSKHSKPSKNQIHMLGMLKSVGYKTAVCYGSEEAIHLIDNYMQRVNYDSLPIKKA